MLSTEGLSRTPQENLVLAFALAGVAGAVNAVGLQELGVLTSHMSGTVTRIAEAVARNDSSGIRSWTSMLAAFVLGAMTATLFVERAKLLGRARYVAALLIEACFLAAFTAASMLLPEQRHPWVHVALLDGLVFAMGMQNALVTKISGAVVRTTHLTGMLTDFGIESVRLAFWLRERMHGQRALDRLWQLSRIAGDAEFTKARLHLTILLSFGSSGALATALYLHYGRVALALPVAVLLVLVIYDRALVHARETGEPLREINANIAGSLEPPTSELHDSESDAADESTS